MVYQAIGTMSGSSMDGLDIALCRFEEIGGNWSVDIRHAACIPFDAYWSQLLPNISSLPAKDLFIAHKAFGLWMAKEIQSFIDKNDVEHQVHLIASHGHTVFHEPQQGMTFQMGCGATIAAYTRMPVVSDLRCMDIALGGQGAPIVPIAEKLLWKEFAYFLNIGGIANITIHDANANTIAFDVCPANRVLNLLSNEIGMSYDAGGEEARKGNLNADLLYELNELPYFNLPHPKSLSNAFGVNEVYGIIQKYSIPVQDKLNTMCVLIATQIANAISRVEVPTSLQKIWVTGGGAYHTFLIEELSKALSPLPIEVVIPSDDMIQYKEAVAMGLIGILRWREENNVLSSVTGASRNSVGGALWMGQE